MDRVIALFERQHRDDRFRGGQLVVHRRGERLVDHVTGEARPGVPVTPDTRFAVFSASKAVVAFAIAMLEDRGVLDVSAPVSTYFPEFAANGKADLTVLDVLTHRAGVLVPEFIAQPHRWGDRAAVREALIAAKPKYPRGTLAYMPYEYGWILAEVVRGALGRGLDDFIHEALAFIPGLRFGAKREELPSLAHAYWLGRSKVVVAGNELSGTFEAHTNLPEVLTTFVPGAGLVCTARDLAEFYDLLLRGGAPKDGQRLLRAETLAKYTTTGGAGFDRSNRIPMRMARGFMLGQLTPSIYGWWGTQHCFGHAGAFCTLAFADPTLELAVAIVTNGNRGPTDSLFRMASLGTAIRRALAS